MYLGKTKPALKGRFNIPIPIVSGFVRTLESKIDDSIKIEFKKGRESTLKTAKKISASWERDSSPDRGDFNGADLDAKKLAIFSGFGVLKLVPSSKPYKQELSAIDYHDVIFEPYGGSNLEKHLFKGQLNIFKTKEDLESGDYDKEGVKILIDNNSDSENKQTHDQNESKISRFLAMGLNPKMYNYVGSRVFNLTEVVTKYKGEDWYVLFSYERKVLVRAVPLKEIFSSGLSPWVSWHTDRDPVNFLNRAPIDEIRPIAEAMRILVNQNFDNIQKRNWDMVLYNAKKILKPSQLEYRPNGIIEVKLEQGEGMGSAYEKMQTPDTSTITINLLQFLNSFIGEKTGVTPGASGVSEEDKVGIYYGNIQQAADRFGMLNKYYVQSHVEIAKRYKSNLVDYMPSTGYMVKIIGLNGFQEEELKRDEVGEELEVKVVSANIEAQNDQITQKKQENAVLMVMKDERIRSILSDKWLAQEVLRLGEYSEERIKEALSGDESWNADLMSEAAKAIEDLEEGNETKVNRGANTAYLRKILNYAIDESDRLDEQTYARFIKFVMDTLPVVEQNAQLMAQIQPQMPQGVPQGQEMPATPELPTGIPAPTV